MGLDEASCPEQEGLARDKFRAESLSAAPIPIDCKRRNYCTLSWVGGMVSISSTTFVFWLWVCLRSTMTEVGYSFYQSFSSKAWSHLRASDDFNFMSPDFDDVILVRQHR